MNQCKIGAVIERGIVTAADESGYHIASFDREGIVSPALADLSGESYAVGDKVYFFLFPDGTGKILCGM